MIEVVLGFQAQVKDGGRQDDECLAAIVFLVNRSFPSKTILLVN